MNFFGEGGSGTTVEDLSLCLGPSKRFEVVHEGYITKRGKVVQNWKRRYMALLRPGVLVYLEDPKKCEQLRSFPWAGSVEATANKAKALVKGTIDVSQADPRLRKVPGEFEKQQFVWNVQAPSPSNRLFYIACDSAADTDVWFDAIRQCRADAAAGGGSSGANGQLSAGNNASSLSTAYSPANGGAAHSSAAVSGSAAARRDAPIDTTGVTFDDPAGAVPYHLTWWTI